MTDMAKTAPEVKAPEIKGVPETVTAAFDEFMEAFEAFKDVNDRRLGEIEQKLSADVVTRDKMDRINRAMDEQKKVLDQMLLKKARPALGSSQGRELSPEAEEHKAAFDAYVRRGDEAGLRELEAKAFSATAGADGGYLVPPETDNEIGRRVSVVSPMRALSTVRTVSTAVLKKPFAAAGLSTGWVAETAARPQTNTPQLAELSFPTMELYAMPAATQALLDDAAVDIEAWIAGEVDIVFAEQEGDAFIRGDGVNKPKGFLTYAAVAESAWTWGNLGYVATGAAGAGRRRVPPTR
nr:phage major capsid protein [Rhizobium sp. Khangiran2]